MTVNAGILNVTGYTGAELARLLHAHPDVRIAGVTGRSAAGKRLPEVYPHLWPIDLPITESLPDGIDVVFSTLPHAAAAEQLVPYIDAGVPGHRPQRGLPAAQGRGVRVVLQDRRTPRRTC